MKIKNIFIRLVALLLLLSCLFLAGCQDTSDDKNNDDENVDVDPGDDSSKDVADEPGDIPEDTASDVKPTYVFGDITLTEGEAIPLLDEILVGSQMKSITYTYSSSNISIENYELSAISKTTSDIKVDVATDSFNASFYVRVDKAPATPPPATPPEPNYGQLVITAPSKIYSNYPAKPITVTFSNPSAAENVAFSTDVDGVYVMDNKIGAVGIYSGTVKATITARTSHHSTAFSVNVANFNTNNAEIKIQHYEQTIIKPENKGGVIFVGDSYFDGNTYDDENNISMTAVPPFWKNFYTTDYAGEKAFLLGISSSQIDRLAIVSERLVYPMEPKEIVVHIGHNDMHHGISKDISETERLAKCDEIAGKIQALLEEYKTRIPDVKIYYVSPDPKLSSKSTADQHYYSSTVLIPRLGNAMKKYAEENSSWLTYVDTLDLYYESDGTTIKNSAYQDNSHPSESTYSQIAERVNAARGVVKPNYVALADIIVPQNSSSSVGYEVQYAGAALTKDYVLEGTIDVTSLNVGNNAFLQFRFKDSNSDRFLLWDSNKDGNYGVGYNLGSAQKSEIDATDTVKLAEKNFTYSQTKSVSFKIALTDNEAYFFVDGVLCVKFTGFTAQKLFLNANNSFAATLKNLKLTTKTYNSDAYNSKLSELNITY